VNNSAGSLRQQAIGLPRPLCWSNSSTAAPRSVRQPPPLYRTVAVFVRLAAAFGHDALGKEFIDRVEMWAWDQDGELKLTDTLNMRARQLANLRAVLDLEWRGMTDSNTPHV